MFLCLLTLSLCDQRYKSRVLECRALETLNERILCAADLVPSITKGSKGEYIRCIAKCQTSDDIDECSKECNDLPYSTPEAEECVLSCTQLPDPVHQSQCLTECKKTSRLDSLHVEDSCSRCRYFFGAVNALVRKGEAKSNIKDAIERACSEKLSVLPICQAIVKSGFDDLFDSLQSKQRGSAKAACQGLGLCQ